MNLLDESTPRYQRKPKDPAEPKEISFRFSNLTKKIVRLQSQPTREIEIPKRSDLAKRGIRLALVGIHVVRITR